MDRGRGRRALVIDNWDSFTANVCGLVHRVTGVEPILVPNTSSPETLDQLIRDRGPDFILIAPGPGNPTNAADFGVNRHVLAGATLPVLGVCLGMQGIAAHHGATIDRVPDPRHGFPRSVHHNQDHPLFQGLPSPFTAVCYNSLCARRPLAGCDVLAWTDDGVVMAVEAVGDADGRRPPQIGVQFHPESHLTEGGDRLIRNFLATYVTTCSGPWHPIPKYPGPGPRPEPVPMRLAVDSTRLPDGFSPGALFLRWRAASPKSDCVWLDSADGDDISYLSIGARHRIRFDLERRRIADSDAGDCALPPTDTFFDYLKSRLAAYALTDEARKAGDRLPFDFVGGYIGYLSYEMKAECGGQRFPNANGSSPDYPAAAFAFVDRFLAVDHRTGVAYVVALLPEAGAAQDPGPAWFAEMLSLVRRSTTRSSWDDDVAGVFPAPSPAGGAFVCRDSEASYKRNVAACKEFIAGGDSYELCLTTQHVADQAVADPARLYLDLRRSNPAPFAAFVQFVGDVAICSCSPERFVRVDRDAVVSSQPIKGTIRRGRDDVDDRLLQAELESSVKDRAENLMITDLVRHDLARCCAPGSVRVRRFCELQRFRHVFQLTSTITGRRSPDSTAVDCLRAAFPPGSMTGAPKIRSVEILERVEGAPRGIYSGALGFLSVNGAADFNVVIRTVICTASRTTIGSGGAIVSLSSAQAEYDEMQLKARAPVRCAAGHLGSS